MTSLRIHISVSELAFSAAFNQTDVGRQQGGKGTGLGLALVRQIVKLSGGRLGVQSKVGRGSTFWVELRKLRANALIVIADGCLSTWSRAKGSVLRDDSTVCAADRGSGTLWPWRLCA